MKRGGYRRFGLFVFSMVVFSFIAAADLAVWAQGRSIAIGRRIDEINRQNEKLARDKINRDLKGDAGNAENAKRNQIVNAQIMEDLEGIQNSYNKIVSHLNSGGELNHEFVVHAMENVKKHAERLRVNLALPEHKDDEEEEPKTVNVENTRQSLKVISRHLYDFVTNPIFDKPAVLDLEQGTKMRRDLDKIIQLSTAIRLNLTKTAK